VGIRRRRGAELWKPGKKLVVPVENWIVRVRDERVSVKNGRMQVREEKTSIENERMQVRREKVSVKGFSKLEKGFSAFRLGEKQCIRVFRL